MCLNRLESIGSELKAYLIHILKYQKTEKTRVENQQYIHICI